MNHIDLFSGIGGFSLAARWCEIETIQFVEIDKFCQKVLAKNFPSVPCHDDIKTFDATKFNGIDLLTGGFPCQPFSNAGKRKGFQDDRYLWPDMFRTITECKPTWIIAENVPGIVSHIDHILMDLEKANYFCRTFIIPASAVKAPHKRDRVWIIAHNNRKRCDNGVDIRKERYIENNFYRYLETIQSEWAQFIPISWKTMQTEEWLEFNANVNRNNDGLSHRVDRIKSLGNAIVPQVVYPIIRFIKEYELSRGEYEQ